ncbi:MAG: TraB/GumN family protein [Pseudomonadota bacterium]
MKNNILLAALASATLLLSSVGPMGSNRALAADPTAAPAAATINADPALWVIKDADTSIYLFGTVHVLKDNIKWFDGGVKAAYDASQEVVLEADISDPASQQGAMMRLAIDPDGPTLSEKLGTDNAAYQSVLSGLGIPSAAFDKLEPWAATLTLPLVSFMKSGIKLDSGVEMTLLATMKADGKKLMTLETVEEQMGYLDALPEAIQIAFLKSTVADFPKAGPLTDEVMAVWAKGNPEALDMLLNKSMAATPQVEKVLLNDRNARWAEWVEKRMAKPGTVFMAVGAGHLAGKNSVQEKLKAKKLTATRIPS